MHHLLLIFTRNSSVQTVTQLINNQIPLNNVPLIKVVENEVYLTSERQKGLLSPLFHLISEPATMRVSEARQ